MLVVARIFAASVLVALAGTLVLMIVAIPDVPTTVGTGCGSAPCAAPAGTFATSK